MSSLRYKFACGYGKASNQSAHLSSLIRVSFLPEETLNPWLPIEGTLKTVISLCRCASQFDFSMGTHANLYLLLDTGSFEPCREKTVFGVYEKATFKLVSSATQTGKKFEISPLESLHMNLSAKQKNRELIRLRGCACWSVPVLFANP